METNADRLNLALRYQQSGALPSAESLYRQVLNANPSPADAQVAANNLGIALYAQKRFAEAEPCFRHVLQINPNDADVYFNLGNVLIQLRRADEAVACYKQALRLNPNHADALNHLGNIFKAQNQLEQAVACYQQALRVCPGHADALNNLGVAQKKQGLIGPAIESFQAAIRSNPRHADAYNNLGSALLDQGQFAQAETCYRNALASDPNHATARYNQAVLFLLQGKLEEGWPGFEQRWSQPDIFPRLFDKKRWDGSPFKGKTVFVYAEQGLGDTLNFIRYLPLVKARGGRVVFECQTALYELLIGLPGVDQLISVGTQLPSFDMQIPLLSLPGLFGTTMTTIPANIPNLHANSALIGKWREALDKAVPPGPFRVGIAWQGNPQFPGDATRSIPLKYFERLAQVPGIRLVSLQKEKKGTDQSPAWFEQIPLIDIGDRLETLADTAAVMKNLNLVISSCTSVAHLAGTLGVPVWTALQFVPNWRWFLELADSPWYPSMRLFRQQRPGDWHELFERIAAELAHEAITLASLK